MTKANTINFILIIIYLVIGIYFIILPFDIVKIPTIIASFQGWITFVAGILMLWIGLKYLLSKKQKKEFYIAPETKIQGSSLSIK